MTFTGLKRRTAIVLEQANEKEKRKAARVGACYFSRSNESLSSLKIEILQNSLQFCAPILYFSRPSLLGRFIITGAFPVLQAGVLAGWSFLDLVVDELRLNLVSSSWFLGVHQWCSSRVSKLMRGSISSNVEKLSRSTPSRLERGAKVE
jgi:hypothetical protein